MAEHLALAFCLAAIACLAWQVRRLRACPAALPEATHAPVPAEAEAAMLEALCRDLRARANGMVGLAEHLVGAHMGDDRQRQAELIADSGRGMIRLLGDVLDVARIDADGLQLHPEATELREVLDHHVSLLRGSARARGLALSLMVDEAVPQRVMVDRARLRQVLLNLIGNAIKFSHRGTIEVQARVAQTAAGAQLAVSVIDQGVGISRDEQALVFQPFFRQPASDAPPRAGQGGGTGLGLALSSRIVRAMGGEIALESAPDLGSCFTVRLPLVEANEYNAAGASSGPEDIALSGRPVLVVATHRPDRERLQAMLETLGMVPTLVANEKEALACLGNPAGDLVPFAAALVDLGAKGIGAREKAQRLQQAAPDGVALPLVGLVGPNTGLAQAAARGAGLEALLQKPLTLESLARTLREVLWAADTGGTASRSEAGPDQLRRHTADPARLGELEARYRQRKDALFAALHRARTLSRARATDVDWPALAAQLHRLAGVAENFGERRLGDLARRLSADLRAEDSAARRHALLARSWADLQAVRPG